MKLLNPISGKEEDADKVIRVIASVENMSSKSQQELKHAADIVQALVYDVAALSEVETTNHVLADLVLQTMDERKHDMAVEHQKSRMLVGALLHGMEELLPASQVSMIRDTAVRRVQAQWGTGGTPAAKTKPVSRKKKAVRKKKRK